MLAATDGRLRPGDEIIRVGSQSTMGESVKKIASLIAAVPLGQPVSIGVRRKVSVKGERVRVQIVLSVLITLHM